MFSVGYLDQRGRFSGQGYVKVGVAPTMKRRTADIRTSRCPSDFALVRGAGSAGVLICFTKMLVLIWLNAQ